MRFTADLEPTSPEHSLQPRSHSEQESTSSRGFRWKCLPWEARSSVRFRFSGHNHCKSSHAARPRSPVDAFCCVFSCETAFFAILISEQNRKHFTGFHPPAFSPAPRVPLLHADLSMHGSRICTVDLLNCLLPLFPPSIHAATSSFCLQNVTTWQLVLPRCHIFWAITPVGVDD